MIGLAFLGGLLVGGIVGMAVGTVNSETYNKRMWDKYMEGMNDGYWIGEKKELKERAAVVKQLERKAVKK